MSQYINFSIRGEKQMLPFASYSRNTKIYEYFRTPYGKVRAVTLVQLAEIRSEITIDIARYEKRIKEIEEVIANIASFTNSIEEKTEAIYNERQMITEIEEEIEEIRGVRTFVQVLEDIIDEVESYAAAGEGNFDQNKYIYAGIEVGVPPLAAVEAWERGEDYDGEW